MCDIQDLKDSIIYPTSVNQEFLQWRNLLSANCYQYALNLQYDFCFTLGYHLTPGDISDDTYYWYRRISDKELIKLVEKDVKKLGYTITKCKRDTKIEQGQWKIAIMNFNKPGCNPDFHFAKQTTLSQEVWFNKFPTKMPTDKDANGILITRPKKAVFSKDYKYEVLGYYLITP